MEQAIADAGLTEDEESPTRRTGLVVGSGGPSTRAIVEAADITREKGRQAHRPVRRAQGDELAARRRRCRPGSRSRASTIRSPRPARPPPTASASAPSRSPAGKQDIVFAGGCEELDWTLSSLFDAMGAMSSKFNDTPAKASPRLRRRPRRLRHRRRRRHPGAGGAGARQGARRQDLRRDRRLRRQLRRLRHGRAVGRGRGALHAAGDGRR